MELQMVNEADYNYTKQDIANQYKLTELRLLFYNCPNNNTADGKKVYTHAALKDINKEEIIQLLDTYLVEKPEFVGNVWMNKNFLPPVNTRVQWNYQAGRNKCYTYGIVSGYVTIHYVTYLVIAQVKSVSSNHITTNTHRAVTVTPQWEEIERQFKAKYHPRIGWFAFSAPLRFYDGDHQAIWYF